MQGHRQSQGPIAGFICCSFPHNPVYNDQEEDGREDTSLSNTRFHWEPLRGSITEDDAAIKVVVKHLYQ